MSKTVTLNLRWKLQFSFFTGSVWSTKHVDYDNIDTLKKVLDALKVLEEEQLIKGIRVEQYYPAVAATSPVPVPWYSK